MRRLGGSEATRLSISQALAPRTFKGNRRPFSVINAKGNAMAVAEIELVQVPLQVLLAAVLVHTHHTAREDAEEAFPVSVT